MSYGIHIDSTYETLLEEAERANKMGATIIQLFVDPFNKKKDNYKLLKDYLVKNKMKCVIHASYTINLSKHWDEYSPHIHQFINEIELASLTGAIGIVVHVGKQLDLSYEEAFNNMYTSLLHVHNKTKKYNIRIFLETPSGQGSEMCYKIEDYSKLLRKFVHHNNKEIQDRFRMCLDTCHIFSAGYDLRTKPCISMYLDILEELVGLRYTGLIHLNDSKNELGANVDRHESLGKGYIGKTGLEIFSNFFKKIEVPIILETPDHFHKHEIDKYLK
jgi:deoxyribonuclease IV